MKYKQVLVIPFLLFINSFLVLGEANTIASANHSNFSVIKVGWLYDSWTIEEQKNAIHFMKFPYMSLNTPILAEIAPFRPPGAWPPRIPNRRIPMDRRLPIAECQQDNAYRRMHTGECLKVNAYRRIPTGECL